MRQQVGFSFRVLEYNSIETGKSSADWSKYLQESYLDQGWEVLSTQVVRAEANSVFLGISLVKYENEELKAKK